MRTVIGLFGDRTEAMRAYTALQAEGFATGISPYLMDPGINTTPEPFQEYTFEMLEVDEVIETGTPLRVAEEVIPGQAVGRQTEILPSPPRRQGVELEAVRASPQPASPQTYEADFRAFYDANLTGSGATYESLRPAFNYGYGLATREPFQSRPWSAIEADARRLWEMKNPGTWEQHKGTIRYAWATVRGIPM